MRLQANSHVVWKLQTIWSCTDDCWVRR